MVRITVQVEKAEADGVFSLDSYDSVQVTDESYGQLERLLNGWGVSNYLADAVLERVSNLSNIQRLTEEYR